MTPCIDHGFPGNKPGGYHQRRVNGRLQYVHRLAFQAHYGYAADLCRHLCHNPRCVNPEHLANGTHQDNANDRVVAGRSAKELPGKRVLTREQSRECTARYASKAQYHCPTNSIRALAREFGVSTTAVINAIRRPV